MLEVRIRNKVKGLLEQAEKENKPEPLIEALEVLGESTAPQEDQKKDWEVEKREWVNELLSFYRKVSKELIKYRKDLQFGFDEKWKRGYENLRKIGDFR